MCSFQQQDGLTINNSELHLLQNNLAYQKGAGPTQAPLNAVEKTSSWNLSWTDPKFISTERVHLGFLRLNKRSPAIDAGTDVGLHTTGKPDLGAYEYRPLA